MVELSTPIKKDLLLPSCGGPQLPRASCLKSRVLQIGLPSVTEQRGWKGQSLQPTLDTADWKPSLPSSLLGLQRLAGSASSLASPAAQICLTLSLS